MTAVEHNASNKASLSVLHMLDTVDYVALFGVLYIQSENLVVKMVHRDNEIYNETSLRKNTVLT